MNQLGSLISDGLWEGNGVRNCSGDIPAPAIERGPFWVCSEVVHHVKSHGLLVVTTTIRARGVECPLRDMRLSEPSYEKYLHIGGTATQKQCHGHCAWIHQSVVKRCSDDRRDSISTRASGTQKGRPGFIFAILTREN
jgi:hypothetical protein